MISSFMVHILEECLFYDLISTIYKPHEIILYSNNSKKIYVDKGHNFFIREFI